MEDDLSQTGLVLIIWELLLIHVPHSLVLACLGLSLHLSSLVFSVAQSGLKAAEYNFNAWNQHLSVHVFFKKQSSKD